MRRLSIITLASLTALGGVAFASRVIQAAGKEAPAGLTVSPLRQTVARGGSASFSVRMRRAKGSSTGASALRVGRLPRGVHPSWRSANGARSRAVRPTDAGAVLTLRASGRARAGTRRVKVLAGSGGATRARTLRLTVTKDKSLRFRLRARPAHRTIPQGASARYKLRVVRRPGFRGRVSLRVLGLSRGASPGRRGRNTVSFATRGNQPLRSNLFVIRGTSRVGGTAVHSYAVVGLTVVQARKFSIAGDLTERLYPGAAAPLNLVLTNPHRFRIRVTALRVRLDTTNPSCAGAVNYAVRQYSGRYPLVLRPGRTRLSALVASRMWPQISMLDLPSNQDACKGVRLSLGYRGQATR